MRVANVRAAELISLPGERSDASYEAHILLHVSVWRSLPLDRYENRQ